MSATRKIIDNLAAYLKTKPQKRELIRYLKKMVKERTY